MALLTAQSVVTGGLEATYAAATGGGDTVVPDDHTVLHYKNASGGDITITLVCESSCSFGSGTPTHDRVVVCTAGEERFIPTGPASRFADATTGLVSITYSGVTSLTVAAIRN
jgi:hypothetical protein